MGLGRAGLEPEWGGGVSKPWDSYPEMEKSGVSVPLPGACMSPHTQPALWLPPLPYQRRSCCQ